MALLAAPVWPQAKNHRALLYRRVLFEARSRVRSAQRRRLREDRAERVTTVDFPDLRPDIAAAVLHLSPQQRAVVVLTYWQDLTPPAVADLLDISEGAVRKHSARARSHLRRVLA